jgi:CBS domain-containing protein
VDQNSKISAARLHNTENFADVEESALRALISASSVLVLQPDEFLFRSGQPYGSRLFILYEGLVERRRDRGGDIKVGPGAILGLSNYLDNSPYHTTAVALEDCTLLAVPADALQRLEMLEPSLADVLNRIIAERIRTRSVRGRTVSGVLTRPVRSAMTTPLAACGPAVSMRDAVTLMSERKIGSLAVLDESSGAVRGVLTYAGLARTALLENIGPDDAIVESAYTPICTIGSNAALWQADEALHRHGVKYLVVLDKGQPVGMISQSDIVKILVSQQTGVPVRIRESEDLADLQRRFQAIHTVAREAHDSNRSASRAVHALSEHHLAIQRGCVEITLAQLRADGFGEAPRAYAILIMGSGGRREMLLNPDQDNGIILADTPGPVSAEEKTWFGRFTDLLNVNLDQVGYVLCPGDVMARNPMYHKTLSEWRDQISRMTEFPSQKAARWSTIVFDFDTLYGDTNLTYALRRHLLSELRIKSALLGYMVTDDAEGRPPLGLFNRLITTDYEGRKDAIDIKRNGLRIIADAARVYALHGGVSACNTSERLQALVRLGVLTADLVDSVLAAYEELLDLLLLHQISQRETGVTPDKLIAPEQLSTAARDVLRVTMRSVKHFQDKLQGRFGREAF